jgi:signal transduction histidine kinase
MNFFRKLREILFKKRFTELEKRKFQIRLLIAIPFIFSVFVFTISLIYINLFKTILFQSSHPIDLERVIYFLRIFFTFTLVSSFLIGVFLAYAIILPVRRLAGLIKARVGVEEVRFRDDLESFLPEVEKALSKIGERIWEGSKNIALLIDKDKNVLDYNHQAAKFLGISPADKGKDIYNILPSLPENASFYKFLSDGMEKMETLSSRIKILNKRGEEYELMASIFPFKREKEEGFLILFTFLEGDHLEDKLYKEELEEKVKMLNRLLTTLSHELKNPLAVVKGLFSFMKEDGKFDPKISELMEREIFKMESLLEDFLILHRPLSNVLRPEWQDLKAFLQETVEGFKFMKDEKKADITIEESYPEDPVYLNFDKRLLQRALDHIFKNALEAMPEGGKLSVRLKVFDTYLLIEIEDTGVGIPQEIINKVFDPFYTTKEDGTGLGLSLASQIIRAHGGQIQLESQPGKGTKVLMSLPLKGEYVYGEVKRSNTYSR